jgi:hypothetical protein
MDNRNRRGVPEGLLPRRNTAYAVMSIRDPAPLLTTLLRGRAYVASSIRRNLPRLARKADGIKRREQ